ncbi:MAG: exo-beta-N-acetylmuramidase NamZ domain-containing protein [Fidelibacterota bacterium]
MKYVFFLLVFCSIIQSQEHPSTHQQQSELFKNKDIPPIEILHVLNGLDVLIKDQIHLIKGKNIGLVTNHTGVDLSGLPNYKLLMKLNDVHLKAIFAPEHGFFGNVSAGQKITNQELNDFPTIFSLYGKTRKPTLDMLNGLDLIIYDIQDVGTRFYTYISTMGLVMEAAAEANIPVMILDRPNPLGGTEVSGPILHMDLKSFVGMYPIPNRYGLTAGELAKMIVGENWISVTPELSVIPMKGWRRNSYYHETNVPWISPSPNIPDVETAVIYAGMCMVEGTNVSEGRGTDHPFKWIGAPWVDGKQLSQMMILKHLPGVSFKPISFTPVSLPGKSLYPKYENVPCEGVSITILNYREFEPVSTGIQILGVIHQLYPEHFELKTSLPRLWGNQDLSQIINSDGDAEALFQSYEKSIQDFKKLSTSYYLYK